MSFIAISVSYHERTSTTRLPPRVPSKKSISLKLYCQSSLQSLPMFTNNANVGRLATVGRGAQLTDLISHHSSQCRWNQSRWSISPAASRKIGISTRKSSGEHPFFSAFFGVTRRCPFQEPSSCVFADGDIRDTHSTVPEYFIICTYSNESLPKGSSPTWNSKRSGHLHVQERREQ